MTAHLRFKLTVLSLLGVALITTGLRCTLLTPSAQKLLEPITINWWGVADNPADYNEVISDYASIHPNIRVVYRQIRPEEFEQTVINALAEDSGPDILSLANSDVDLCFSKIAPLPATTRMAYQTKKMSLGIKEETIIDVRETTSITVGQIRDRFIDVVASDVIRQEKIYGLPLSVETLVLLYNKDLFNAANLALPPQTWLQFQDFTKSLTSQNRNGDLIQSGAAIGGGSNVAHAFDILSLLMMQNGTQMILGNQANFHQMPSGSNADYNPGPEALRFYTDFADSGKEVYAWNQTLPNSLDAFAAGQAAMAFVYQQDIPTIDAKRLGNLNYGVAKVPQIEGRPQTNIAHYVIQTVSKKSQYQNEAWDFLQFISSKSEAEKYLKKTGRATALRSLVDGQLSDDTLRIFADQLLTAKNWYHGKNFTTATTIFVDMISQVLAGSLSPTQAAEVGAQKITQTL